LNWAVAPAVSWAANQPLNVFFRVGPERQVIAKAHCALEVSEQTLSRAEVQVPDRATKERY